MKLSLVNWHITPRNTPLGYVPCSGLDAIYEGLRNCDYDVKRTPFRIRNLENHVVCWGWKRQIGQALRRQKKEVLVAELGYIGDRKTNISLGWNGLNGHAEFPDYPDDGGERFRKHGGVIKPWKRDGDYILILGQVKGDASLRGKDIMPWYLAMAKEAERVYGLPVRYRPHPESTRRRGYESLSGFENIHGSLSDAINGALFTISYNSNSCLDSIMSGTPCYAGDRGTMVWDLCMKNLDKLYYPEREGVLHQIAWKQWTLDEIRCGLPFERLFK